MRWIIRWAGLALAMAFVVSGFAADDKVKDKDPIKAKDKDEAAEKMVKAGEITGKLIRISEGSQQYLTIQVTLRYQVPNPGAIQNAANVQLQIQQTILDRNMKPLDKQRKLLDLQNQLAQHQRNAYTAKEEKKDFELKVDDDLEVRTLNLPTLFDDKGKPRTPTAKEKKELKGDRKLPGYKSDLESLMVDQIVTAYLSKKKEPKGAPKEKDPDGLADNKPMVTMILIRSEVAKPGN